MNRYHDLSREELANLSEEQINHYIEVEIAHKGVEPVSEPQVPTIEDVGIVKNITLYRVGGSYGLLFLNEDDAKAAALMPQMEHKYSYEIGTEWKWAVPCSAEISEEKFYDQADVMRVSKALQANKAKQEPFETAQRKWDKYLKETGETRALVWEAVAEAREFLADIELGVESYKKFLSLAEGNVAIAGKFFRDAYTKQDTLFIETVLGHPDLGNRGEDEHKSDIDSDSDSLDD